MKAAEMFCVEGLPGLSGKLELEERHRAEQLSEMSAHDLAWTLVERERQLAEAIRALART